MPTLHQMLVAIHIRVSDDIEDAIAFMVCAALLAPVIMLWPL
jgi:hypothetical protein